MCLLFMWCVVHVSVLHVDCDSCGLVCVLVVLTVCVLRVVVVSCVLVHSVCGHTVSLHVYCCSCGVLFMRPFFHVGCSSGGLFFLCVFFMWFVFMWLL